MKEPSKVKVLSAVLTPPAVFLGSFASLVWFFSQQSGTILWENLVASALLAGMLGFFAILCVFSRWVLPFGLIGALGFVLIGTLAGGDYRFGTCFVSFYCLNQHAPDWLVLLIKSTYESIFLIDLIAGATLGVRLLVNLNAKYPQTRYFMGTFLLALFTLLLSLVQGIPDVPQYNSFQLALLSLMGLLALVSFCFGLFYKKIGMAVDKWKRIYGAGVISLIFLLPLLAPLKVSSPEDQKAAFFGMIFFGATACFSFIYLGFFAKKVAVK